MLLKNDIIALFAQASQSKLQMINGFRNLFVTHYLLSGWDRKVLILFCLIGVNAQQLATTSLSQTWKTTQTLQIWMLKSELDIKHKIEGKH